MLPAEDIFVHCYVLVDDLIKGGWVDIPARPGPKPACTDAEIITIVLVRHLLCRRSESGFLAEIRREWPGLFRSLPHVSEFNRRARWLYGAYEQIRAAVARYRPMIGARLTPRRCRSHTPAGSGARTPGVDPTTCTPASVGMPRTASGFMAFVSRRALIWARGWSARGGSCPPRSTNATSCPN